MLLKELELMCKTYHNSPANRPELVDTKHSELTANESVSSNRARIESQILLSFDDALPLNCEVKW
jgi:hypothetical protein